MTCAGHFAGVHVVIGSVHYEDLLCAISMRSLSRGTRIGSLFLGPPLESSLKSISPSLCHLPLQAKISALFARSFVHLVLILVVGVPTHIPNLVNLSQKSTWLPLSNTNISHKPIPQLPLQLRDSRLQRTRCAELMTSTESLASSPDAWAVCIQVSEGDGNASCIAGSMCCGMVAVREVGEYVCSVEDVHDEVH